MREIKFRAWDLLNEEMKKVRLIHLGKHIITDEKQPWDIDLAQVKLMQYTGLKDKNGKEIYEGDIVDGGFNGGGDNIKWCDKLACFHIFNKGLAEEGMDDYCYCCGGEFDMYEFTEQLNKIEVVGNIYENPNLLNND